VNYTRRGEGLLEWAADINVILSRDERERLVYAGGGETEGEESLSRSDC
jgi:hypothetical protein